MFRATRPYLSEPVDPILFLRKYRFFFVGVFIIEVSILTKKGRPNLNFKDRCPKHKIFFWPYQKSSNKTCPYQLRTIATDPLCWKLSGSKLNSFMMLANRTSNSSRRNSNDDSSEPVRDPEMCRVDWFVWLYWVLFHSKRGYI